MIALAVVFLFSLVSIPVNAEKAGEIIEDVYTDNTYGFSFGVPTGWGAKMKKSKSALRVTLTQKSPVPPRHFQGDLRDYMQIPTIRVLVDTTTKAVDQFVDELLDSEFKSKQKKNMMKMLSLISKPHEVQKRRTLTVGGVRAVILEARQAYTMEVSVGRSDRAEVVQDFKSGAIFFTVREDKLIVFHLICEYQTGGPIIGTYQAILESLRFGGETESKEEPAEEG
jgi:hypothetical protein